MRIQLQLDDDLVDIYQKLAGRRTLEKTLVDQLARFQSFAPTDALLILTPQQLGSLDAVLGVGSTLDADALLKSVASLASLNVGTIKVHVTPKQWDAVHGRAEKQGRSLRQVCADAAERILAEIVGH